MLCDAIRNYIGRILMLLFDRYLPTYLNKISTYQHPTCTLIFHINILLFIFTRTLSENQPLKTPQTSHFRRHSIVLLALKGLLTLVLEIYNKLTT